MKNSIPEKLLKELMANVGFETPETQKIGDKDFRECAVWTVRKAIEDAFAAGVAKGGAK